MDATTLKDPRAALSARYREDPASAVVTTLGAEGEPDGSGVARGARIGAADAVR